MHPDLPPLIRRTVPCTQHTAREPRRLATLVRRETVRLRALFATGLAAGLLAINLAHAPVSAARDAAAPATPMAEAGQDALGWYEVRTDSFTIFTDLPKQDATQAAAVFEWFRSVMRLVLGVEKLEATVPTYLYILERDYDGVDFGSVVAARFDFGLRANYAAAKSNEWVDGADAVRVDYARFMLRNLGEHPPPVWFEHGLALFLQSVHLQEEGVPLGWPYTGYDAKTQLLDWFTDKASDYSYRDLVTTRVADFTGERRFHHYRHAWLLTHHLLLGHSKVGQYAEIAEFFRLSDQGSDPAAALEKAFGIPLQAIDEAVLELARNRSYSMFAPPDALQTIEMTGGPLRQDAAEVRLAELLLAQGQAAIAERHFAAARMRNPKNADALAGLGTIYAGAGRHDEARRLLEDAQRLAPDNPHYEVDLARLLVQLAADQADAARRDDYLRDARRHLARSFKLNPVSPETLTLNAMTYRFPGGDNDKAIASLEAAVRLLPSHPRPRRELALAYLAAGRRDDARRQAGQLLKWAHHDEVEVLEQVLQQIDAGQP